MIWQNNDDLADIPEGGGAKERSGRAVGAHGKGRNDLAEQSSEGTIWQNGRKRNDLAVRPYRQRSGRIAETRTNRTVFIEDDRDDVAYPPR